MAASNPTGQANGVKNAIRYSEDEEC
jgi:hypothetical protein